MSPSRKTPKTVLDLYWALRKTLAFFFFFLLQKGFLNTNLSQKGFKPSHFNVSRQKSF